MRRSLVFLILLTILTHSCSSLQGIAGFEHPDIRYIDVSVEGLTLENIDLRFHFEIDNPNRVGVKLEEYAYELLINDRSFLTGSHQEQLEIGSRASGSIALPLTLSYHDIYESFSSVIQADSFSYTLKTEVGVDIPAYGKAMIPVEAEGTLPRLRMPEVGFAGFDVHSLSFSGVDMTLSIQVRNPNPMGMNVSDLNLAAAISGNEVADLSVGDISVESGDNVTVPVRFTMGLANLGTTVIDMLRGNQRFNYDIRGDGMVQLDHPAFRDAKRIPFHLTGDYRIGE